MSGSIPEQLKQELDEALRTIKRIADLYEQPTAPAGTATDGGE